MRLSEPEPTVSASSSSTRQSAGDSPVRPAMTGVSARRIFDGDQWHDDRLLMLNGAKVVDIVDKAKVSALDAVAMIEIPAPYILVPGFIDIQVNGGGGVLLNDQPTLRGIRAIAAAHRRFGTTGLLPTLITDTTAVFDALLNIATDALEIPGVVGFHLEGPFLNPARSGIHRRDLVRRPTADDIARLMRFAKLGRSVATIAPEMFPLEAIKALTRAGLILSVGHSNATYDQMQVAINAGVTGVTHLFNAMSQIGPRDGGVVGAAFDNPQIFAGLISDGHHVSASNQRLALRQKYPAHLMLVTDAMPTVASELEFFNLQGQKISRIGDRLSNPDGTLAGAHLTLNQAVSQFVRSTGTDLKNGLICATSTPAAFLGLSQSRGQLKSDMRADFVAIDPKTLEVFGTWIGGVNEP